MTIEHYSNPMGGLSRRRIGHELTQISCGVGVATARVQAREDIQNAQVEAMASVTQRALQGVAFVTQVEQQLAQAVPMSATRLQAIGDIGTLGMSQIVVDTANKLRRM